MGVNLDDLSRDLRDLLTLDGMDFIEALTRAIKHHGVGRAFLSGVLILHDPEKSPMVNSAAVRPFTNKKSMLWLIKGQLREAKEAALKRHGVSNSKTPARIAKMLTWSEVMWEVRKITGFENFFEVDQLLWKYDDSGSGVVIEPEYDIETIIKQQDKEDLAVRRNAEQQATSIIEEKLGRLDERDIRDILRLVQQYYENGKIYKSRFNQALRNPNIAGTPEVTNLWVAKLWRTPEDDLEELLDEFWQADEIKGAGISFPSLIPEILTYAYLTLIHLRPRGPRSGAPDRSRGTWRPAC